MAWVPAALTTNLIHALIPRAQRWSLEQIRQFIHNLDNRSLLVREGEEVGDEPVRWSLLKSVRRFVKSQMGDASEIKEFILVSLSIFCPNWNQN